MCYRPPRLNPPGPRGPPPIISEARLVAFFCPAAGAAPFLSFAAIAFALVLAIAAVAAGTARLKLGQASRIYLSWGLGVAVVALILSRLTKPSQAALAESAA